MLSNLFLLMIDNREYREEERRKDDGISGNKQLAERKKTKAKAKGRHI